MSRRSFALVPIIAVATGVAALVGSSGSTSASPGAWSWAGGAPGRAVTLDDITVRAARLGGVDPQAVREVIASGDKEGRRLAIYSAPDGSGNPCLGFTAFGIGREFHCLSEPGFDEQTVIPFVTMGGRELGSVDRATVMGVARSDVARIVIRLVDGSRQDLQLNQWRAFAYTAGTSETMPAALVAYRADGSTLQVIEIDVGP